MSASRGSLATLLVLTSGLFLSQCGLEVSESQSADPWDDPSSLQPASRALRQPSILINELYVDDKGRDVAAFTELAGPAGASLEGLRLVGISGESGAVYAQVNLSGYAIGPDGLFVISQVQLPEADLVAVQVNWQNGPDRVELRAGEVVLAGLTYGDPSGTALQGSGGLLVEATAGASLGLCPEIAGKGPIFTEQAPTPGGENACAVADPDQTWNDASSCGPLYGLSGKALRKKLLSMVDNQIALSYARARTQLYTRLDLTDGKLECVYTGRKVTTNGRMPTPTEMNCEHTWPQSQGAVGDAKTDLHHLFPVSPVVNSTRNNTAYGWVAQPEWEEGGSKLGEDQAGNRAFEVRQKQRGNSARAMFYFAVRYEAAIDDSAEAALKLWNRQDLPDARERERNEAIYEIQSNRNPFVDCPSLVDQIADF